MNNRVQKKITLEEFLRMDPFGISQVFRSIRPRLLELIKDYFLEHTDLSLESGQIHQPFG